MAASCIVSEMSEIRY